jgi:hypothetical protein
MEEIIDGRVRVPLSMPVGKQQGVRILYADSPSGMTKRRFLQ